MLLISWMVTKSQILWLWTIAGTFCCFVHIMWKCTNCCHLFFWSNWSEWQCRLEYYS